jgi:hypothetical protein
VIEFCGENTQKLARIPKLKCSLSPFKYVLDAYNSRILMDFLFKYYYTPFGAETKVMKSKYRNVLGKMGYK